MTLQMEGTNVSLEQARIAGYLGECFLGLGDFKVRFQAAKLRDEIGSKICTQ